MNLTEELFKKAKQIETNAPKEILAEMQKASDELIKMNILDSALKQGDLFPDFALLNQTNETKNLRSLYNNKEFLVISFYRGGWCPYCNLELKALQENLSEFEKRQASLIAISPENPDASLSTSEMNDLKIQILSDTNSKLAAELGISFKLPENLKPVYEQFGIDIPKHNGNSDFTLPVPATYIVGSDRKIHYAFFDLDYKLRCDPKNVISELDKLVN